MAFSRSAYDKCSYLQDLTQSVSVNDHFFDVARFEHKDKCRNEFGLVGGTTSSHISGNLVDLESDLFGVTRKASLSPNKKYLSSCALGDLNNCKADNILIEGNANTQERIINTNLNPLPICQMFNYKPLVLPEPLKLSGCNKR